MCYRDRQFPNPFDELQSVDRVQAFVEGARALESPVKARIENDPFCPQVLQQPAIHAPVSGPIYNRIISCHSPEYFACAFQQLAPQGTRDVRQIVRGRAAVLPADDALREEVKTQMRVQLNILPLIQQI